MRLMLRTLTPIIVSILTFAPLTTIAKEPKSTMTSKIKSILLPGNSPLISFRILFMTGAASDPKGKEGLASLTAAMLSKGGSRKLSYDQIVEAMYPLATSFNWQVDKEMTVFYGTSHVETLDRYYALISQMLLDPGFREEDFTRLKSDAINFLKVSLRESNDEELGKEYLYNIIYKNHPYGHHNVGRVSSLESITLDDVRDFYKRNYIQENLRIGLAGNYPKDFLQRVESDFSKLSSEGVDKIKLPQPKLNSGMHIEIIKRETRSTAFSLGFPIDVKRGDKDWPALFLVASYFGQHRSSNSYLYNRLREKRGLNYGDYSYIEYFPRGMYQFTPDPNLGRQQQIFQIWLRPVEPQHGHFILRAAIYEYDKLIRDGISKEAFEATREFLGKYSNILTETQGEQLGYALDSQYYGIDNFNNYVRNELAKLKLEDVNAAIVKHLKTDRMQVVIVTKDAEALRDAIIANKPSPITYNAPKPKEILEEDKIIEGYKINIKPEDVVIVPVDRVFQ
jgi:zinc protease